MCGSRSQRCLLLGKVSEGSGDIPLPAVDGSRMEEVRMLMSVNFMLAFLRVSCLPRSGTSYYKPDTRHSCCPHYTIRYMVS